MFTEEYVRRLADQHGWGWLPMDEVTLTFNGDQTRLLMPPGTGAALARQWLAGQRARRDADPAGCPGGVSAMVHRVNAECPELTRDGRFFGVGEMFGLPARDGTEA